MARARLGNGRLEINRLEARMLVPQDVAYSSFEDSETLSVIQPPEPSRYLLSLDSV